MTDEILLQKMIAEHYKHKPTFASMKRYYDGEHDIKRNYIKFKKRANRITIDNFVNKFVNEEVQYSLGNPLSYVSLSNNKDVIEAIYNNTFHWKENHNQELMKTLEIFGTAYILNYIDSEGRFSEKILSPLNSICYCDDDGKPFRFIHFYKKPFDDSTYRDVYYPEGRIDIYKGETKIDTKSTKMGAGIPVSVCRMEDIKDTIYFKIKSLQDSYNNVLSDQVNTISDFRTAYFVLTGCDAEKINMDDLDEHGMFVLPQGATADWLTKNLPDTYIQNMIKTLREAMYANTNHIDGNEKLQSNTSGTALRNRLVFLEQRCNLMVDIVLDAVYERIERLFNYLAIQKINFDVKDIKIVAKPCIPQDEASVVSMLNTLGIGTNVSLETALSQLSFIENPSQEIEKIKNEIIANAETAGNANKAAKRINLDVINDLGDDDE